MSDLAGNLPGVPSQVYVPMTRDDLESAHLPVSGDVTPEWANGERTKSSSPADDVAPPPANNHFQRTSHPTPPAEPIAIHG